MPTPPGSSCSASRGQRPDRPAGDGSVRGGHPRPTQGGAGGLPAGTLERSPLKAGALLADGSVVPLELVLALGEYEGEPSVRLIVPATSATSSSSRSELETRDAERSGHRAADCAGICCAALRGAARASRSPAACATSPACARTNSPRSSAISACSPASSSWSRSPAWCARAAARMTWPGISAARRCCCCSSAAMRATSRPGARI